MKSLRYSLIVFFIFLYSAHCNTNEITYKDPTQKDITISQLEDIYFLHLFNNNKIHAKLTGENFLDLNNFNTISRVRTYTAIKIEF